MDCSGKTWSGAGLAMLAWLIGTSGCATTRLPAIDPSGQQILLPSSSYTTIAPPAERRPLSIFPQPAFVAPPPPPPCPTAGALATAPALPAPPYVSTVPAGPPPLVNAVPPAVGTGSLWHRERNARLQITPSRLLAPVGGEVVLRAGLCGDDGYLVTRQPIQWMLSADSVGTLVAGNTQGRSLWNRLRDTSPPKRSGAYTISWTSTVGQAITRGTPSPVDDVWLLKGQTWISLTSASEGVSHVTALAPSADGWDQRRQTATIHWVDAQWTFPPPAAGRVGEPRILTTNIRRPSNGNPVAGWLVRYQIVGGAPAALDARGVQVVDVRTDQNGNANVQVLPRGGAPGTTQLSVQVIRTSAGAGDLARLAVGEGVASISWNAAGLAISTTGPPVAELDSTLSFSVEVSNPGGLAAAGIVVSSEVPFGLQYVSSDPPGQVFGDRVQWRVDQLAALELRRINVNFRATRAGPVTYCAGARLGDGSTRDSCVTTTVLARALGLEVEGPERAEVGDQIQFRGTVTNTSDQPLAEVVVVDHFDSGLRHFNPEYPAAITDSPIERPLGPLAPGESRRFAVSFVVQSPGELCNTLEIITAQGASERVRKCVIASGAPLATQPELGTSDESSPRLADLAVRKTRVGPPQRRVGDSVEFSIEIRNTGPVELTQVRVVDQFEPALEPLQATTGAQQKDNQMTWYYASIGPGQIAPLTVRYRCVSPSPRACATVTVTASQELQHSQDGCVEILSAVVPPAAEPEPKIDLAPPPQDEPETAEPAEDGSTQDAGEVDGPPDGLTLPDGDLILTVNDMGDPVRVGQPARYYVTIQNDRKANDKDIVLRVILPAGNDRFSATPPPGIQPTALSDGRTVTFSPIAEMRVGETVNFVIDVTLTQPGQAVFRAEVTSQDTTVPIADEEDTTVTARMSAD